MAFPHLRLGVTALIATTWLSGCSVFNLDESSIQSAQTVHGSATVPFRVAGSEQPDWLIPESDNVPEFSVIRSTENGESDDFNWINFLGYLGTLSLIPYFEDENYVDVYELNWQGDTVLTSRQNYTVQEIMGVYFPTPLLFPGTLHGLEEERAAARPLLDDAHRSTVLAQIQDQQREFVRIDPQTPAEIAAYLEGPGKNSVYRPAAILRLIAMAPEENALDYHARNVGAPGYLELLPVQYQAWLIGPAGLRGVDIETKLAEGATEDEVLVQILRAYPVDGVAPHYAGLTNAHRDLLIQGGLPTEVVKYMSNKAPSPQLLAAARTGKLRDENGNLNVPTEEELLEQLVRNDNNGKYMSPYTSDGVLAEWVDSAINANIGSTVGSGVGAAAGAYAADKALENVPFGGLIGGMVGSEVGESMGRETAISASGGWEAIRETSDRSFDSIESMVEYLRKKYGNTPNYADAMAATAQIYPDLQAYL